MVGSSHNTTETRRPEEKSFLDGAKDILRDATQASDKGVVGTVGEVVVDISKSIAKSVEFLLAWLVVPSPGVDSRDFSGANPEGVKEIIRGDKDLPEQSKIVTQEKDRTQGTSHADLPNAEVKTAASVNNSEFARRAAKEVGLSFVRALVHNPVSEALIGIVKIGRSAVDGVAGLVQGGEQSAEHAQSDAGQGRSENTGKAVTTEPERTAQADQSLGAAKSQAGAVEKPQIDGDLAVKATEVAASMDGVANRTGDKGGSVRATTTAINQGTSKESGGRFA